MLTEGFKLTSLNFMAVVDRSPVPALGDLSLSSGGLEPNRTAGIGTRVFCPAVDQRHYLAAESGRSLFGTGIAGNHEINSLLVQTSLAARPTNKE